MEEIIPIHTDSYDTLNFVNTKCVSVYKKVGYTPLQVLESIRPFLKEDEKHKCTYVGRLDPMAEGWIYILWSGDMEEKKRLSSLDKVYEIDIILGLQTDTGDALGLVLKADTIEYFDPKKITENQIKEALKSFIGPFTYMYPTYSSPYIKKTLSGKEIEKEEGKLQKGYIHKIDNIHIKHVSNTELYYEIIRKLSLCHMDGEFRLDNIQKSWKEFFEQKTYTDYLKITLCVHCGSGTYMRTLAEEFGKKLGTYGFALGIRRIGVGKINF